MGLGIYGDINSSLYGMNLNSSKVVSNPIDNALFKPNFSLNYTLTGGGVKANPPKQLTEKEVAEFTKDMLDDNNIKNQLSAEITLDDNSKSTYAKRLQALVDDYVVSENSSLSQEEYAVIKSVAYKFARGLNIKSKDIESLKEVIDNNIGDLGAVVDADIEKEEKEEIAKTKKVDAAAQYPTYTIDNTDARNTSSIVPNEHGCIAGEWKNTEDGAIRDLESKAKNYMNELIKNVKEQVTQSGKTWTKEMQEAATKAMAELMPKDGTKKCNDIINGHEYKDAKCDYQHLTLSSSGNGKLPWRFYGIDERNNWGKEYSAVIDVEKLSQSFQNRFNYYCLQNAKKIDKDFKPEA